MDQWDKNEQSDCIDSEDIIEILDDETQEEAPAPEPEMTEKKKRRKEKQGEPEGKPVYMYSEPPKKAGLGSRICMAFKFFYMVITVPFFIGFILLIVAMVAMMFNKDDISGRFKNFAPKTTFTEQRVMGNGSGRIAIIDVAGVIYGEMYDEIDQRLKIAEGDSSIKAIILRVSSPGGSVSASDQIHHRLSACEKPLYAFMSGVAASGGYYVSVACDEIIAEPTAITGSIGVIMQSFNFKGLFSDKLGISPITIKSGERKDWPSTFGDVTPEQLEYIDSKLIKPAYDRFVDLVNDGRPLLDRDAVVALADGSIYHAREAVEKGLVDRIGYLSDVVNRIAEENELKDPEVITYEKNFSFETWLSAKTPNYGLFSNAREALNELKSPELMYLWQLGL
ncbi:MAG: signal peptide peptidase SppA [Phycisphaerae bacterium]